MLSFYLLLPAYMSTTCVSTMYVSTTYVSGIGGGQREGTRSLEVELQERVSLSVCTGYQSRILWKSSWCSQQLDHLSNP